MKRSTISFTVSVLWSRILLAVVLLAVWINGNGAVLKYEVSGVPEPMLSNALSHVSAFTIARQSEVSNEDYDVVLSDAIAKAQVALRPYGYYQSTVSGRIVPKGGDTVVQLTISAGPPMIIDQAVIQIEGEGKDRAGLKAWRDSWPLKVGQVLDQTTWDERKQYALTMLSRVGFLSAAYTEHRLELDLEINRATLALTLDTGRRYMFGDIDFGEHVLKPGIVEYIPRFENGDPYNANLLDKFRLDLWRSGYFTEVAVKEIPRADQNPPVVDLEVQSETTTRNTYQGSIGYGTDTSARLQGQWSRHPMSSNGDRIDIGIGWQEFNDEYSLRGTYRLPRRNRAREFWISDLTLKHEGLDLDVRGSPDEDFVQIASGTIDESHLRVGRLKVRNFKSGEQQAFETLFVQALNSTDELAPITGIPSPAVMNAGEDETLFGNTSKVLSVGFDYDLVAVYGKAWETDGHRERAWIFASGKSFGSDRDFVQAYVSTRISYLKGERWKFLLRAEAGYTDADVSEFDILIDGETLPLSVTSLPNFYRFKTGGSNSVRGYGFEELSNNHVGSNHILSASAEVEMKFLKNWSAALFFDIGNAFNDWSNPELKKGVGVGLRWYSIAGPIRIDVAQALDLIDRPWRIHFTIGTPLL